MSDRSDQLPLFIHWPVAIIASVSGLAFAILMGSSTVAQISTEHWENTTGIVEDYEMICIDYEDNVCGAWEEDIVYSYNINGKAYTNNEISLSWRTPNYGVEQLCEKYGWWSCDGIQIGDEIDVFFNPENPSDSVLLSGWDGIDFGDFIILGFSTMIPLCLLITARLKGKISDGINEWKEIVQTREKMTGNMNNPNVRPWINQSYQPTQHKSLSYTQYGISPSRMRGYNSAIAYLSLNDSMDENTVKTLVQSNFGISANDAAKFVESTYVKAILFPNSIENGGQTPPLPSTIASEPISKNFISEDEISSQEIQSQLISNFQVAIQEAIDLQEYTPSSEPSIDPNKETCSHPNCKNEVSFYSFQCFSCRKKFCDEHKGASIHCADCA